MRGRVVVVLLFPFAIGVGGCSTHTSSRRDAATEADAELDADVDVDEADLWPITLGGIEGDGARDVAVGRDGVIVLSAAFDGVVDLAPGPEVVEYGRAGEWWAAVLALDPSGHLQWVAEMPWGAGAGFIAVADDGKVAVTGGFGGIVDFDPGPATDEHTGEGLANAAVILLDSDGSFLWARTFGGEGNDSIQDVAVLADGSLVVAGAFQQTVDFDPGPGSEPQTAVDRLTDGFVVRLDESGELEWVRVFAGPSYDTVAGVAAAADGSIVVTGCFAEQVDLDPGPGVDERAAEGGAFFVRLSAEGDYLWGRAVSGAGALDVATDGSDRIALVGAFRGTVDFDPGPEVDELTPVGEEDVWVALLDIDGEYVWARSFGGPTEDMGGHVAFAEDGAVLVGAFFMEAADFDPGPGVDERVAAGHVDSFVAALEPDGAYRWAATMGGVEADYLNGLAATPDGGAVAVGTFEATAELPGADGPMSRTARGMTDAFLVQLAADGRR